jgi:hypothetical protein
MNRNLRIESVGAILLGLGLLLPPMQGMAWWLILPCLITLVAGWRLSAFVILLGCYLFAETVAAGVYLFLLTVLVLMSIVAGRARAFGSDADGSDISRLTTVVSLLALSTPVFLLLMALLVGAGARLAERQSSGSMQTGISESMSPDSVTRLVASTDLAFRVQFSDEYQAQPLPASLLYWRGVVLENFDGKTWLRDPQLELNLAEPPLEAPGNSIEVSYEVTQEPHRAFWLYGLHEAWVNKNNVYRDTRGMLVNSIPVRQRIRYPVTSYVYALQATAQGAAEVPELDAITRARNLALPEGNNPQSLQWAQTLRQQFDDDAALTQFVLEHFFINNFYYTVTPPAMAEQGIDDFLFNHRQGFCGHYASALSFVLRAAGIPARVVGGYQGGEFNTISNHLSVYQYNAHAWVEAWYPGQGWVQHDPTAWVAPQRIDLGMEAWLQESASADFLNEPWQQRLQQVPGLLQAVQLLQALAYESDRWLFDDQGELRTDALSLWLEQRGLGELPVWLMAAVLMFVILRTLSLRGHTQASTSAALRLYMKFDAAMGKQGLGRSPGETMNNHLARIASAKPASAEKIATLSALLDAYIYAETDTTLKELRSLFKDVLHRRQ